MEKNIPKDPLSELFRKKLRDEELENTESSADEWDLPSDGVWEGLSNNLPPAPPSSPALKALWTPLTWAAVLMIGIGISYCIFSYQQKLATLTKQVEALQAQQDLVAENDATTQETMPEVLEEERSNPKANEENDKENQQEEFSIVPPAIPSLNQENDQKLEHHPVTSTERPSSHSPLAKQQQNQVNSSGEVTTNDPANQTQTQVPKERTQDAELANAATQSSTNTTVVSPDAETVETVETVLANNNVVDEVEKNIPHPNTELSSTSSDVTPMMGELAMLPIAPIAALSLAKDQAPLQTPSVQPIIPKVRSSAQGFYVGAIVAPTSTFIQVKGKVRNLNDFQRDKTLVNTTWGLETGYHWNRRWSVSIGGQYSALTSQSRHFVALKYSKQRERLGLNQRFESDYEVSIPTAYGDVDSEISLYREMGTVVADNTEVPLRIQTTQQLELLTLPVMVQYRLMDGPLRVTAQAGLAASFVLDNSTQILATTVNRRGILHQRSNVTTRNRPLRSKNVEYLLGMGLEWQVAPKWQVSVEPVFSQSIRPIFDNSKWKSSLVKSALTFGIQYQI